MSSNMSKRLMWLFGVLFVVFGLPLAVIEDGFWQQLCGVLSTLSLGCFALAMAGDGLVKGEIRLQFSLIQRAARPRAFWAAIGLVATAGVGVILSAFWMMFIKAW